MTAQQLYLIQKVDIKILDLQKEQDTINAKLLSSPILQRADATFKSATNVYNDLVASQDRAQHESDTLNSKIAETDSRLYSGRVTNPKELSDLADDLKQLRKRQETSDDQLLRIMDKVERMQVRLAQAEKDLELQTDLAKQQSAADRLRLGEIGIALDKLSGERAAAIKQVDPTELNIYDQLMSTKGNTAVAEVHVGRCTECKIMVSSSDSRRAHTGKELVHCSSCGRILLS
tara:strand:- start:5395 stop:6090 length:696 start_codon:yes stop_codon:yes gene_type:complete